MANPDVGIVTKMSKNYGAVLQAYALKNTIDKMNRKASIINYNGALGNDTYRLYKKGCSPFVIRYNLRRWLHRRELKKSIDKFQNFRRIYFDLTSPFNSYKDFLNEPPQCDTYVVGSDQVWNPEILFTPIYYLNFGKKETKRVSYAASFGKKNLHPDYLNEIEHLLKNFNAISVRESSGAELVEKLGGTAEVVLDPTLLLEKKDWETIAAEVPDIPEKYVLCYFLHYPPEIDSLIADVKQRTGYTVINIATNVLIKRIGDVQRWDVGPEEFVWLFQHAQMIFTSSFHGTVFSIIFNKPFFTLSKNINDGRLKSILDNLGLSDRLVSEWNGFAWQEKLCIDFHEPMEKLAQLRKSSKLFLMNNL